MADHSFWRWVEQTRQSVESDAPDGYSAIVEVRLAGRPDPLQIARVVTLCEREWTAFQTPQKDKTDPSLMVVLVRDDSLATAEIRYVRKESAPVGFTLEISDDDLGKPS